MEIILSKIVGLILKAIPAVIIKMFIKPEAVKKDFEVDFRSINPFILSLNHSVPSLHMWLRYTNKSPIPIYVDRVHFSIQVGQGSVEGFNVRRVVLQPKETNDNIYLNSSLSELQKQAISYARESNYSRATINLYLYCQSKIGDFEIEVFKEYLEPKFE